MKDNAPVARLALVDVVALTTVAMVAFQRGVPVGNGPQPSGFLLMSDMPMVVLVGLVLLQARSWKGLTWSLVGGAAVAFIAGMTISLVVSPSIFGGIAVVSTGMSGIIGLLVARLVRAGRTRPISLLASCWLIFETLLAVYQRATGRLLGLQMIGESDASLYSFPGVTTPSGTLSHRNTLGVISVVLAATVFSIVLYERRSARWWERMAIVAGGLAVGLSLSRTATLTIALVAFAIAIGVVSSKVHRRNWAICSEWGWSMVGWLVAFALQFEGWTNRTTASSAGTLDDASSGRIAIMRQAVAIWRLNPLFGTGPNRYLEPVWTMPEIAAMAKQQIPVHNYWLLALASYGIFAGIALAVLTGALIRRSVQVGLPGIVIVLGVAPGLSLDVALVIWHGLFVAGLVLGVLCGMRATSRR